MTFPSKYLKETDPMPHKLSQPPLSTQAVNQHWKGIRVKKEKYLWIRVAKKQLLETRKLQLV